MDNSSTEIVTVSKLPAVRPGIGIVVLFGLLCWVPMFLVDTPHWCLWIEALLVFALAYCFRLHAINNHYAYRKQSWVAIIGQRTGLLDPTHAFKWTWWVTAIASLAVLITMVLVPVWSSWNWLFPAVATVIHLLLIGLLYSEHIVP